MISLGLVIIGRNEELGLRSLANILPAYYFDKIVYVDSNSIDQSVAMARSSGWQVITLQQNGVLSAAAGRAIGTLFCETEWILYLDGDMLPDVQTLAQSIEYLKACQDISVAGITGDIVDVYSANSSRVRIQKSTHQGQAKWFGGAVILKRQSVLDAGNWNPNVYANEEIELYARLNKLRYRVLYFHKPLVYHYTTHTPYSTIILNFLYLHQRKNPRNNGMGLAIRSSIKRRSLSSLISLNPEPFLTLFITPLLFSAYSFGFQIPSIIIFLSLFFWIGYRRGPQYIFVCYLLMPQMLIGPIKYKEQQVIYRNEHNEVGSFI